MASKPRRGWYNDPKRVRDVAADYRGLAATMERAGHTAVAMDHARRAEVLAERALWLEGRSKGTMIARLNEGAL